MDSEATERPDTQERPAAPWYQRVLPVSGLVLLLVALAAVVVPSFRDQVSASLTRQSQQYVELYFTRPADGRAQAICLRKGSSAWVRFVLASHLDERKAISYRVAVRPEKGRTLRKAGTADARPGTPVEVVKRFAVPRGRSYTIAVVLPGLGQQLRADCPGRP